MATSVYWSYAIPAPGRNSIVTPGGQTTPCTYDNYQDSGKFLGRDCATGDNKFSESSAGQLVVDENQSNILRFWEAGTWNFCAPVGFCAPNGGVKDNNVANITDTGIYGKTIFTCTNPACVVYSTGNQNAVDTIYHAQNITLYNVVLDGGQISDSVCLDGSDTLNLYVYRVAMQNCYNLASGGLRITNWNTNQLQNRNIFIRDISTFNVKIGLTGTQNGYLRDSVLTGMPPANINNYLVDMSKADFQPSISNNLGQFCFCNNIISGWTKRGIFGGFQAISNDSISGNTIVNAPGFATTTDTGFATYCNGLDIANNWFSQGSGSILFNYCNFVTIINNHWTIDNNPSQLATAISISPDASAIANQPGQPNHFNIQDNSIRKWGGISMELNFTNGLVEGNQIYDGNQGNGNPTSNAGILIDKGLRNVLIDGNGVISDVNSGVGQSRPINYEGAKNITISNNFLFYQNLGGAQAGGIFFGVAADKTVDVTGNTGYNPVGKLTNFIVSGGIGICGTGTTVSNGVTYTVCGTPIVWSCTGGTVTAIVEKDFAGFQIWSVANCAALPSTYVYTPLGYSITFTESVTPTLTVFGD